MPGAEFKSFEWRCLFAATAGASGGVHGMRVSPLGLFGQTGDQPDLYREYRLDAEAILDATVELFPNS